MIKYEVCKPCTKGRHTGCLEFLKGGVECACLNSDCIWIRAEGKAN